jgi:hypothetical protein
MKSLTKNVLFWTPRILCLLFVAFISLFALDAFEGHRGLWDTAGSLLVHLIPAAVLLILLALAWRREFVGGLAFPALGAFYLVWSWGRFPWPTYAVISGSLFLIGSLFLLNWRYGTRLRAAT